MGNSQAARILVFDVGGSHASAALASNGSLKAMSSSLVNSEGSPEEIMGAFENLGNEALTQCGLKHADLSGVSLGFPNPFDYEAGISYMEHKYGSLYGYNIRADLAKRFGLGSSCVTFVNDASAYLLGELHFGAAVGISRVIGITLGTGVGSAFAVSGRIITQGEGVPNDGFLWNIPYKGRILEDFVSTRGIRALYKELGGDDLEVREIASRAATEACAKKTMQRFGEILGEALHTTCTDFRPEAIVLGGAISRSAHLFIPAAHERLKDPGVRLLVSRLFDEAALLGASVEWQRATAMTVGR